MLSSLLLPRVHHHGSHPLHVQAREDPLPLQNSLLDLPRVHTEAHRLRKLRQLLHLYQDLAGEGSAEAAGPEPDRALEQGRIPLELRDQVLHLPRGPEENIRGDQQQRRNADLHHGHHLLMIFYILHPINLLAPRMSQCLY